MKTVTSAPEKPDEPVATTKDKSEKKSEGKLKSEKQAPYNDLDWGSFIAMK